MIYNETHEGEKDDAQDDEGTEDDEETEEVE